MTLSRLDVIFLQHLSASVDFLKQLLEGVTYLFVQIEAINVWKNFAETFQLAQCHRTVFKHSFKLGDFLGNLLVWFLFKS